MAVDVSDETRQELMATAKATPTVRRWRRYPAILLVADGQSVAAVARALGCTDQSVQNWIHRFVREGVAGLAEGTHRGAAPRLDEQGVAALEELVASDPQQAGYHTTGWTAALLQTALAQRGFLVSDTTVRRTLRRRNWRWKRPKYVFGRPDPDYEKKSPRANSGAGGGDRGHGDLGRR
jgi:transposase